MVSCNYFEDNYEAWKQGKLDANDENIMRLHASQCAHCLSFSDDVQRLRASISELPQLEPEPGFEFRLRKRIREASSSRFRKHRKMALLPRWAAIGAGMATGIAIGYIVLLQFNPEERVSPQFTAQQPAPMSVHSLVADQSEDADTLQNDTLDSTAPHYDLSRHSETVSTGEE